MLRQPNYHLTDLPLSKQVSKLLCREEKPVLPAHQIKIENNLMLCNLKKTDRSLIK